MGKLQNLANPLLPNVPRIGTLINCSTQYPFYVLHRHVLHFFLFAIWLFFWSLPAQAQNTSPKPIEITTEFTERKIGHDISILEDPSKQLTFDQVRTPEIAAQYVLSTKDNPNFGFTPSAYWAHFKLNDARSITDANNHDKLYLKLAFAPTDLAELWCADVAGTMAKQRAGDHVPRVEWPTSHREPTFKIEKNTIQCWLRLQTTSALQFPLTLYTEVAFVNMRLLDNSVQAMYFGALLVMLIYNSLIAVTTRSVAYVSYSAFLLSFGIYQSAFFGLGYSLLWRNMVGFADSITLIALSAVGISTLVFTSALLDLSKTAPRWFKFNMVLILIGCISLIFPWVLPYTTVIKIIYLFLPVWAIILLGSGTSLAFRGSRIAKIYLAAWIGFIFSILLVVAMTLGWVPVNVFTTNGHQVGSVIEFVLFSFALADRIKTTQANLLNAQKKIADGLRLSEQELTEKVQERTASLETAKNQAELAQSQTAEALADLKATQSQLIEAERLASLGQLVGGVAHEINNPIGVIRSNSELIAYNISLTMKKVPLFIHSLQKKELDLFQSILEDSLLNKQFLSSKEERQKKKEIKKELEDLLKENSNQIEMIAEQILILRIKPPYKDLFLGLGEAKFVESLNIAQIFINQSNSIGSIEIAVEKSSRVVFALRNYLNTEMHLQRKKVDLIVEIEKALHVYDNYILGKISILKEYPNSLEMMCIPENLLQVWKNIIFNAVQAMYLTEKRMEIKISKENELPERILKMKSSHGSEVSILPISDESEWILVSFLDSGMGIPEDLQEKLFSPFFTTKALGEGIGLGLYISKKIIHEHGGKIFFDSKEGSTEFVIGIPYEKN